MLVAIVRNSASVSGSVRNAAHASLGGAFPPVAPSDPNRIRCRPICRMRVASSAASSGTADLRVHSAGIEIQELGTRLGLRDRLRKHFDACCAS